MCVNEVEGEKIKLKQMINYLEKKSDQIKMNIRGAVPLEGEQPQPEDQETNQQEEDGDEDDCSSGDNSVKGPSEPSFYQSFDEENNPISFSILEDSTIQETLDKWVENNAIEEAKRILFTNNKPK